MTNCAESIIKEVNGSPVRLMVHNGYKVTIERTWRERLFSRPWRPFQKEKVEHKELLKDGEFIQSGPFMYANAATVAAIKAASNARIEAAINARQ